MDKRYKDIMRTLVRKLRYTLVGAPSPTGFVPGSLDRELERIGIASDGTITPVDGLLNNIRNGELRAYHVAAEILNPLPKAQRAEARHEIIERAAYTWINRLLALRMMEVRRLIYSTLRGEKDYEGLPEKLYFLRQEAPQRTSGADGGWWAVIEDACNEQAKALPGLFALNDPGAALRPAAAALIQCIEIVTGNQPLEVDSTPEELDTMFADPDAIGWAYQFYQEETKARIDAKCKVGGKVVTRSEIAAKTELFTEPYMVHWLLQNSLGRSYHEAYPQSHLPETWEYYVQPETLETAITFDLDNLTLLDPCMGSGHFLRVAFDMFVAMYREQKPSFTAREIADNILSTHLFGIDLDPRAAQLTALTLYLRAWELVRDEQHKARKFGPCVYIPPKQTMNLATTPVGLNKGALERHLQRAPQDKIFETLLENIFTGLEHADILGSLLRTREYLDSAIVELLKPRNYELEFDPDIVMRHQAIINMRKVNPAGLRNELLETIANSFKVEAGNTDDVSVALFGYEAERGVRLLQMLDMQYSVVATNPPYLGSSYMDATLKKYIVTYYKAGKRDLYAAFILRCLQLCKPDGRIAMVTMHSWMFLHSFADLRALPEEKLVTEQRKGVFTGILRETSIDTLAHLGANAFEEINGEVVQSAMFALANRVPSKEHIVSIIRLVGLKNVEAKRENLLAKKNVLIVPQTIFNSIPGSPFCYWLGELWLKLLANDLRLDTVALVREGLHTTNNARFLRCFWEVSLRNDRWVPYVKGGGYGRWAGLEWLCVDWQFDGERIRSMRFPIIPSYDLYFKIGFTYTDISGGAFGARFLPKGRIFDSQGPIIVARTGGTEGLACITNSRPFTYMLRALSPTLHFRTGYVRLVPIPKQYQILDQLGSLCVALATCEYFIFPTESLFQPALLLTQNTEIVSIARFSIEALIEEKSCYLYELDNQQIQELCIELGTPVGWYPLIVGYDSLPDLPDELTLPELPQELHDYLSSHENIIPNTQELVQIKANLRALYEAGPGAKGVELEGGEENSTDEESEGEEMVVGTHIPIPVETFLEELSLRMQLHPISVYWLLKELRSEGVRCKSEEKRLQEDRLSILVLLLLGHLWPKQLEAGETIPVWADEHGIIPLVSGTGKSTFAERVRERLRIEDGALATQQTEALLQELTGQNLEQWLRQSFFTNHIRQFKHRPIAWHLASKPVKGTKSTKDKRSKNNLATFSKGPAFECLLYYHAIPKGALTRIRVQYIEPLLNAERNKVEQKGITSNTTLFKDETSFERDDTEAAIAKLRIQELEAFAERLQRVEEEGFAYSELQELLAGEPLDIWDGDGHKRPSSYDEFRRSEEAWRVDINDGVRVNIAPLQLAGVLATEVLKPADAKKAISDRARWRSDERRWVRDGKLPRCGWMDEHVPASKEWLENEKTRDAELSKTKPQQLDWTQEGLGV